MSDDPGRIGLDNDELPKAKDAVHYIADKHLLGRIAELQRSSSSMVREPSLPIRAGELPFHLEPSDWRAGYLGVHEIDLPPELYGDLKQNAPQALLRDLFRPEREAFVWHDRETLVTLDWGGTQALRDARAAQKLDDIPVVAPIVHAVVERAEAWRKVVNDRWQPILDDGAPRKKVFVVRDPSVDW